MNDASTPPQPAQPTSPADAAGSASEPQGGVTSAADDAPARTASTPYALLGGEPGVRALVDRFYDLMDLEPAFAVLRRLHPSTLEGSRDKLSWYLCGWLGGPNHYVERFGHPRLRARHLPYAIGDTERDQWMACMTQALREQQVDAALVAHLTPAFAGLADWMRNQ